MENIKKIYHGSQQIVERPLKSAGKVYNDYGQGFYCTESIELAKEWACPIKKHGYANQYRLNLDGLKIVYLNRGEYHILNWLAVLLQNRTFDIDSPLGRQAKSYILEHFFPDLEGADVIIGYRADDSYFSFADDFINNVISLRDLERAMALGMLGEQIVLISEKAFSQITFAGYEMADYKQYYFHRVERDQNARSEYRNMKKDLQILKNDIFILDIIREGMTDADSRLRCQLSE